MKVLNYITYDSWWDTDVTVLPYLTDSFDINVYVLTPRRNAKYETKTILGVKTIRNIILKYRDRDVRSLFWGIRCFWVFSSTIFKRDCLNYYVLGQNWALTLLLLLFLKKRNTIISFHNYREHQDRSNKLNSIAYFIKKWYCKKFLYFHFYSKLQHELFQRDCKKYSFYTNMPLKDFGRPKIEKDNSNVNLLFFGMVREYKRLDLLIEAANMIQSSGIRVTIVGKCDSPEKYIKMMKDRRMFDCYFGFVDNSKIPDLFQKADFLVLPYSDATQSGPSLIAINYGIPIISSDLDALRDIVIDGYNGFVFSNGSASQLADIFKKLTTLSREDLETMKNNQFEFKRKYIEQNDILRKLEIVVNRINNTC